MANVSNGNTIYLDTTGDIADTANIRVMSILLTSTTTNAQLILEDQSTADTKVDVRLASGGDSALFDYSSAPLTFPNGINVDTISNAVATLVVRRQGIGG